ncbi:MAG: GNAT family N-acetyltransferase [Flavobacteriales bacterium]|nr:GNAT family N-acetyltransferase [Flavobacteriales bacterium]MBP6697225.1 GNAT family N-acetyltransferase [Flavobacteriales bacterium]
MRFSHYELRPIIAEDAEHFFRLIDTNRPRLEDFFAGTVAVTQTLEETRTHVANMLAKAEARTYFAFALVDSRTGRMAGFVDIKSIDWKIPKAELGAFMDASYEGQGIASQALAAITYHGFHVLGFDKLLLRTHESNTGSRRVAEKNGYLLEGTIRKDYRTTKGEVVDLMYYGRVR